MVKYVPLARATYTSASSHFRNLYVACGIGVEMPSSHISPAGYMTSDSPFSITAFMRRISLTVVWNCCFGITPSLRRMPVMGSEL